MSWMHRTDEGVVLNVRVVPRAPQDKIDGVLGEALKIRLRAPPVEGKANKALVRFLAETTGLPRRSIAILGGPLSRNKRVLLRGADEETVRKALFPV